MDTYNSRFGLLVISFAVGCSTICDEATDRLAECGLDLEQSSTCSASQACASECMIHLSCAELKSLKGLNCFSNCTRK
jgi:hypothetical protein